MQRKERNASFELLRIVSMCMVIMLHALGKSGVLGSMAGGSVNTYISWLLESLCIQAVNVYVLISGYFLVKSKFKTSRLLELICQVLFYSLIGVLVGIKFNLFEAGYINNFTLFEFLFPIHSDEYWFVTKYVIMYLFSPVLALAVNRMGKKQLQVTISLLLLYECIIKSICPIIFIPDKKGYDALWFMILFLVAGYIRLYGLKWIKTAKAGLIIYVLGALLIMFETFAVSFVNVKTGHFAELKTVACDYNHIFAFVSSVGLFMVCVNGKEILGKASKIICSLSPMTLGVYLFHENPAIRFKWQGIFKIADSFNGSSFKYLLVLLMAVLVMYIVGTCFDFVRKCIFSLVAKPLSKSKLYTYINKLDGCINGEE